MIRLSIRQIRIEFIVGFAALVTVAIVLAVTGPHLVHISDAYLKTCSDSSSCASSNPVTGTYTNIQNALIVLVLIVPVLIGIFLGSPLIARELETGTFRLAWTQSVTRTKWLVMKLGVVGLASMLLGGLLSLMATWWLNPVLTTDADRFSPSNFGLHGIVEFGYSAFAFALGASAGTIFRKTLPAMAVSVVGFIAARLAVTYWVRPNLESPLHENIPLRVAQGIGFNTTPTGVVQVTASGADIPNALVSSDNVVNRLGQVPSSQFIKEACPGMFTGLGKGSGPLTQGVGPISKIGGHATVAQPGAQAQQQFQTCIAHLQSALHVVVTYQPANRYWPFQIYETAIFVAAALLLGATSWWWVRHRLV